MVRRLLSGVAVLALSLALFGCGGDDDDDSSDSGGLTTGDVSVDEFLADANAICAEDNDEISSELNAFYADAGVNDGDQLSPDQQVQVVEEVIVPGATETLSALRALEVPESDAGRIEELYAGLEQMQAELEADPASFFDGRVTPTERAYAGNASDYGLQCP